MDKLKEKVKSFPHLSGVYLVKNKKSKVIYVGKASSLRKRALSYFSHRLSPAKEKMMQEACSFDYLITSDEAAALILEAALIKELRPKYNIELKDDKNYPYVKVSKDGFPYIEISRKKEGDFLFFGPYARAYLLKEALALLRKIFPFRSCRKMPKKACLFFDLKLCPAPCLGRLDKRSYQQNIDNIIMVLEGKRKGLLARLERQMQKAAKKLDFEKASQIKRQQEAINSLYLPQDSLLEVVRLKEALKLKHLPLHIEAVDISNLSGRQKVGSVVVFLQGRAEKSLYRRFRLRENAQDDARMMAEVVRRRLQRLKAEKKPLPDLLLLDGAKAQISLAAKILQELGLNEIEVVGIAKRKQDKIWLLKSRLPLYLSSHDKALRLLQRARDEAHRFARSYHLLLRRKSFYEKEA